ncbi:TPA: transcriptional regulator, RpiR family protein [Salmonella enterica]|nr:transcriptional regulator, RpiR family protein [Salmonella enterica subsp. enterica serovar Give]EED4548480.1 transcriptional regulator, RpiR family protein [Salmonella enterica subsp. enterica serovar Give]ELJ7524168.1 transcriptional regulator, RpiR family protein [Salmonella enterica]EMD2855130.1 transcriptional regulator, RpiR family protein [Salmonella enterica]HDC2139074.1 transcriptional regulator, RpiR family protein [Salmonella enterica]
MHTKNLVFYSRLYIKASEYLFHAAKETVYVRIAKEIVDKIDEFPHVNIEELALASITSPSSVTRFCHLLGYSSFHELKNDTGGYEATIITGEPQSEQETLEQIYTYLPFDACQQMAEVLTCKRRILVITNEFTFDISNMLKAGISNEKRRVYTVDRTNTTLINFFLSKIDCILILTLTGEWIAKEAIFLNSLRDITGCIICGDIPAACKNIPLTAITMRNYPYFMSSNYHSHKYMESIVFNIINKVR